MVHEFGGIVILNLIPSSGGTDLDLVFKFSRSYQDQQTPEEG